MTAADGKGEEATTAAAVELAKLRRQAAQAQAELSRLRTDIAAAKRSLGSLRAARHLREANENLVIAALKAQSDAEAASRTLDEASRTNEVDTLTGLPNRLALFNRLIQASTAAKDRDQRLAVLFIDLNGFKRVNDMWGHTVGDQVLRQAAQRLVTATRTTDTVSRYGGDEFLVLLNDVSRGDAAISAGRVVEALTFPVHIGEQELWLTASVGIGIYPDDANEVGTLVDRADAAMYRAKRRGEGNGGYAFHSERAPTVDDPCGSGDLTLKRTTDFEPESVQPARYVDLREANEHLVTAAIKAQELCAAAEKQILRQNDFVAVVAHELRNPLSPILAAAQLMGRTGTNHTPAKAQAIIERQVGHMSRLVNDLLEVSRVTTGRFKLERQLIDFGHVIDAVIDNCRHLMDARFQVFEICKTSTEVIVDGDAGRLAQALSNLMDNASKYTPEGGTIKLEIEVDGPTVVVTVSDTGIGISAGALPYIFEPFLRDTHAIVFNHVGFGIGLTVVRELLVAHGGSVTAQSAGHGLGSRFVVTLPLAHQ
ncbi:MAG: diguanylate cyclase domain-containing protein [Janthinobacterium lividum]